MGGSARLDVQSLAIIRPMAVLFCGMALLTLKREQVRKHAWTLAGIGLIFCVLLLYALPVPQSTLLQMPGHRQIAEIELIAGIGREWSTATLVPELGWNAISSLSLPLAVILLGIQLEKDDLLRTLPLLIILGAISGLFGLLQVISSSDSPFYFYQLTNEGSAVGLFANRNHAAVLLALLIPMLAVYGASVSKKPEQQKVRLIKSVAALIVLVPLILVTGSRSGFIIAMIGIFGAAILFRHPTTTERKEVKSSTSTRRMVGLTLGVILIGLVSATLFFSRATAIDRLFANTQDNDLRQDFWISSLALWDQFVPLGSGPGTFVEVYRLKESNVLLDATYLNHAHNDWVETIVALGFPGLILMGVGILLYLVRFRALYFTMDGNRRTVMFSRLAAVLLAMLALASFVDYPLRTPTMMSVFALLILWLNLAVSEPGAHNKQPMSVA